MMNGTPTTAEHQRLATSGAPDGPLSGSGPWNTWGPYLAERAWGTVREDYTADGSAWDFFPHDHARSRAYRWNEDGMAGVCDLQQRLCLALALWNGRDPILKERMFGLTGSEGNHGEDAKDCWWYLDALPSHALAALALPLPPAGLPLRRPGGREPPPGQGRPGVRAAGHRRLRAAATGWWRPPTPRPGRTTWCCTSR